MNLKKAFLIPFLSILACLLLFGSTAGAAPAPLEASPASVDFGNSDIHTVPQQNATPIVFANNSGADLTLGVATISGSDAADFSVVSDGCSNVTLGIGGTCYLYVDFTPSSVGDQENALVNLPYGANSTIVPLTGIGATGTLTGSAVPFEPYPWNYGIQPQQVQFTNNSPFVVIPGEARITGADAADFSLEYNGCTFTLYPTSACYLTIYFKADAPGEYHAQLELDNDGTVTPAVIPLEATALSGPNVIVSPPRYDFGDVAINGSSPKQSFTVSNNGDYPVAIPILEGIGGDPDAFPISNDDCDLKTLSPGDSCGFQVAYKPTQSGPSSFSVYVPSGLQTTKVVLKGNGVAAPGGSVSITGTPQVTKSLNCSPLGFPDDTRFSYQWLVNGDPIKGAVSADLVLGRHLVGQKISCALTAGNSVGTQKLASAPVTVRQLDLSGLPGSLVDKHLTRSVKINGKLKAGGKAVQISAGHPVSAQAPLVLHAQARMVVSVDGIVLGKGKVVSISPRALSRFANGVHVLNVFADGHDSTVQLKLASAALAATINGGPFKATDLTVSSLHQLNRVTVSLPKGMRIATRMKQRGMITFQSAVVPTQSFPLDHSGRYNGVKVEINARSIVISNLSAQTGQIRLHLVPGALRGTGGVFSISVGSGSKKTTIHPSTDQYQS